MERIACARRERSATFLDCHRRSFVGAFSSVHDPHDAYHSDDAHEHERRERHGNGCAVSLDPSS
jgi:hypothetical protein